jgi:hypothetical protein
LRTTLTTWLGFVLGALPATGIHAAVAIVVIVYHRKLRPTGV